MDQDPIVSLALAYLDWRNGHRNVNPLNRLPDWVTPPQREALRRQVDAIDEVFSVAQTIRGGPAGGLN